MKSLRAMLIDADYITKAGRAVIRLLFKRKRFFRLYDESFEPYFFVDVEKGGLENARKQLEKMSVKDNQGNEVKLERVEEAEKELLGEKKKVLRAVCRHPSHVVLLRDKAREVGTTYEDNILFGRRYLIDKNLTPLNEYEVKRKGKSVVSIGGEKEIVPNLRLMSFDIETYNPSGMPRENVDPVVMVSFADEESGVLSWKPVARNFVKTLADEKAMLAEFCRLLKEKDVELLVGYNSAAFDFSYLKARAKALGVGLKLGRDESGVLLRRRGMMNTAKITGRIHVDLYPVIRFMGTIGALKGFRYTLGEAYSELVAGEKEGWKEEVQKREIWRMWDDEEQLPKLAEYALKDAQATREIALKILPLQYELCKLVKLPLFDVAGMTSGQLVEMLLLNKAHNAGMIAPNKPGGEEAEERRDAVIEGAFVKMPTPGIYENLAVFDFRSLYPSIITSHNVDNATLNCSCCSKKEAFVSPNGHAFCAKRKGLIPNTLEELVERRKKLKGEIKECKDDEEKKMLEARSQALKILSNSVYGMFRFARARWYSRECGEAITAWGRHYIQETAKKAEEMGFEVIYADTDSCFLKMGNKTHEQALEFMRKVNAELPKGMELELEAFYPRGVFVGKKTGASADGEKGAKKKYALLREDGKIKIRGFELVRRDWSDLAKETQSAVLESILKKGSKEKAVEIVKKVIKELKDGKVPLEKLVIHTQLRKKIGKYEILSPEVTAAIRAKEKGIRIEEGAVIDYVVGKSGGERVSDRSVVVELAKDYDPNYYIENQILPSVMKILSELGVDEHELKGMGKQAKLGGW